MLKHVVCALLIGAGVSQANASLLLRTGGMVYDDVLNITWLADANYAKTSGHDPDGYMTWFDAVAWADGLVYGGYSDWRLPRSVQSGINGYDCIGSEMCALFYSLGGVAGGDIRQVHNADFFLFADIQGEYYWSETTHPVDTDNAFDFRFEGGVQSSDDKLSPPRPAWAVRDGDVSPVPAPGSLALLLAGFSVLQLLRIRRHGSLGIAS